MTRPELSEKNDWYSEIKLEGIWRRLKEQGDDEEQEVSHRRNVSKVKRCN